MAEIPDKHFYKLGEVSRYTDTQPYVLRFWESEFPQLAPQKNRTGQRVYRREDLEMILRIKKLLYEQEYTIADARRALEREFGDAGSGPPAPASTASSRFSSDLPDPDSETDRAAGTNGTESGQGPESGDTTQAERVESLESRIAELEERCRSAEEALRGSRRESMTLRERAERVARRLESVLARLSPPAEGPSPGDPSPRRGLTTERRSPTIPAAPDA